MSRSSAPPVVECPRLDDEALQLFDPFDALWDSVPERPLTLWSGAPDPLAGAREPATCALGWTADAIHCRVIVPFETLHVEPAHPRGRKAHGLWEHDVAELFLSRGREPTPYGEVEVSPIGQWLDYFIEEPRVRVDRAWNSSVLASGRVEARRFAVLIHLPFRTLGGSAPSVGDERRANVYVAQGPPGARRHLALAPTATPEPDFHVPARFAVLRFTTPRSRSPAPR